LERPAGARSPRRLRNPHKGAVSSHVRRRDPLAMPEQAAWLAQPPGGGPLGHPLPGHDAHLLGHRRRDPIVAPENARQIHPGGGLIRPTLLVDGLAAGVWRLVRRSGRTQLILQPFAPLNGDVLAALAEEVAGVGRFLETTAELVVEE